MKKNWEKASALLLTAAVGLSLTACGGETASEEDWRTEEAIAGGGTMVRNGLETETLVTVDDNCAYFYLDQETKELFDTATFPQTIENAQQYLNAMDFSDLDGDGSSDLMLNFIDAEDDSTELVWLWDPEEGFVFQEDLSTYWIDLNLETGAGGLEGKELSAENNLSDYVGLWEYTDENLWLRINEDATWEFLNDQEDVIESGVLWIEKTGITLHFDGSGDVLELFRTVSGDLIDDTNDGYLVPAEAIESQVPEFERHGLARNASMDEETYLLKNGVSNYYGAGKGYQRGDCYWEVTKKSDNTHGGIREIEFDAICYIPKSSMPNFSTDFITTTTSELYDYYSGTWLTAAASFNNTQRGDNGYLHTIGWHGETYQIEFFYSTKWQDNVGDWGKVLTKSYIVYLPEDYDGLIFAAETEPENYADYNTRMQLDTVSPDASIVELPTVEPEQNLYFGID